MLATGGRDLAEVLQRERLAADEVGAGLHAHVADRLRATLVDEAPQRLDVEVALERMVGGDLEPLGADQLHDLAAVDGDVLLGGGEVVIHRDQRAGADHRLADDVLRGAALVGGQEVIHAEDLDELVVQARVGRGAGVGVVGHEHRRLLILAHRVDAGVREHVQEHVGVLQQEGVEAGLFHRLAPLLDRQQRQLLNDSHLVHLERQLLTAVELHLRYVRDSFT